MNVILLGKKQMFINEAWKELSYKKLLAEFTHVPITNVKGDSLWDVRVQLPQGQVQKFKNYFPDFVKIKEVKSLQVNQVLLSISKADLVRCRDNYLGNPIRQWADIDGKHEEYDVRLLATLFVSGNSADQYNTISKKYLHEQRAIKGKDQQILNWLYDEDGYPGRVEYKGKDFVRYAHEEAPVIFLDPHQYLKGKFTLAQGKFKLSFQDNSPIKSAFDRYSQIQMQNEPQHKKVKLNDNTLEGNFAAWKHFVAYLLGDGKEQVIADLQAKQKADTLLAASEDVESEQSTNSDSNKQSQEIIVALQSTLKLFSSTAFFNKFTKDKGVLQSEQYFTTLFAHIHAEIGFLRSHNTVSLEDLKKFQDIHTEINELLTLHDFLAYKELVHRDAQILLTKKEVKDLFKDLRNSDQTIDSIKAVLADDSTAKLLCIPNLGDEAVENIKNFIQNNSELGKNNLSEFLSILQKLAPENVTSIKLSAGLRVKEVLYNLTYYIPGSSLWLKYLHPGSKRVVTGYKRDSWYCKNLEIEETESAKTIREKLSLEKDDSSFVPSKHEAKCLVSEFRLKRNMMGAKEKFIFKIKKNRFVWLPVCIVLFVVTLGLSIASRVLLVLNVIPPYPINSILEGIRGFTESFAFIFGLDTFIDFTLLRVLDFAALAVKYIDRYLLGCTVRSILRLVTGVLTDIFHGIKYGVKSCIQSIIDHGFIGSVVIATGNVKQSLGSITGEKILSLPRSLFTYIRDKMFLPEERSESFGFKIPVVCAFYHLHKSYKNWRAEKQESCLSAVKSSNDVVTLYDNPDFNDKHVLASEKERIKQLEVHLNAFAVTENCVVAQQYRGLVESIRGFNSVQNVGNLQTKYTEIRDKLHNFEQKDKLSDFITATKKIRAAKQDWQDFLHKKQVISENIQDYAKVSILKTALFHKQLFGYEINYSDPLKSYVQHDNDTAISRDALEKKISVIDSFLSRISSSNIPVAQSIAEPIFTITREHEQLQLKLKCYKASLEQLKKSVEDGEFVSESMLYCLNYQFKQQLSDAFMLFKGGFNKLQYNHFHGQALQEFLNEFGVFVLSPASSGIKVITGNLKLYEGRDSSADLAFKRFAHFVEEYQDPRRLIFCLMLMSILRQTKLSSIPDSVSELLEMLEHGLGLEALEESVMSTPVGKVMHEIYGGEILRDMSVFSEQICDILCWSKLEDEHNNVYTAEDRAKGTVNTLCALVLTIIGINTIKSIAAEKNYNTKDTLQKCYAPYFSSISLFFFIPAVLVYKYVHNMMCAYALFAVSVALFAVALQVTVYAQFCCEPSVNLKIEEDGVKMIASRIAV